MIGIVRHFKVNFRSNRRWMTAKQFNQWVAEYDQADIDPSNQFTTDVSWDVCLTSDLLRASKTAELIFTGTAIPTEYLREIAIHASFNSIMKLPVNLWLVLGRIAWYFSHISQSESRVQTQQRANLFIDAIENDYPDVNVLIVTHGAFMKVMSKELKRRGYQGKVSMTPQNGELYLFHQPMFG